VVVVAAAGMAAAMVAPDSPRLSNRGSPRRRLAIQDSELVYLRRLLPPTSLVVATARGMATRGTGARTTGMTTMHLANRSMGDTRAVIKEVIRGITVRLRATARIAVTTAGTAVIIATETTKAHGGIGDRGLEDFCSGRYVMLKSGESVLCLRWSFYCGVLGEKCRK